MKSRRSRGRVHKEAEHPYRSAYQRDRDRIVHSAAFRRLEYKTQVFVIHESDYYRTRLTHSLEVSQIARTIAGALRLNRDLVEAIALAHDLGHTPFGHAGEEALDGLMSDEGGFNHNRHGLRVVDQLEDKYPDFPGLNLTYEVREGIIRHSTAFDKTEKVAGFPENETPSLETQVVDIADEIAYDNHDLDDGLASGLLNEEELEKLPIWDKMSSGIGGMTNDQKRKYLVIRSLINMQVTDLIEETGKRIAGMDLKNERDVRSAGEKAVVFSPAMLKLRRPLRGFLMDNLYHHYRVMRMSNKARRFITQLFNLYTEFPEQLPPAEQGKINVYGKKQVVCDYIAGMTDRYALDEYKKLFDPYEKV
ncbi:MAG: deoxyguanosinetriphosphate triphosphohydrolase [Elusimicrobia bacterium]|nr:deoxyguanosinetriphosphate triphosphohydrolase [Elusimicrobiota bacterium]